MTDTIVGGLVVVGVAMLAGAFSLPVVRVLLVAWTWLYTLTAAQESRDRRRLEVKSDVHDQITDDRADGGMNNSEIALRLAFRFALGVPADFLFAAESIRVSPVALSWTLVAGVVGVAAGLIFLVPMSVSFGAAYTPVLFGSFMGRFSERGASLYTKWIFMCFGYLLSSLVVFLALGAFPVTLFGPVLAVFCVCVVFRACDTVEKVIAAVVGSFTVAWALRGSNVELSVLYAALLLVPAVALTMVLERVVPTRWKKRMLGAKPAWAPADWWTT